MPRSSFTWTLEADVVLEDDTTHRVGPFGPRDLIDAERQFGMPMALMMQYPRLEHVAFLAWRQLIRRGVISGEFDAFVERLADMTTETEEPQAEEEAEEPGPAMALSPNGSP